MRLPRNVSGAALLELDAGRDLAAMFGFNVDPSVMSAQTCVRSDRVPARPPHFQLDLCP